MSWQNHDPHGHSPKIRPLLLVGLVIIAAVHLLAVGAVRHLTTWIGPLSLTNPLTDVLIGSILVIVLFKLSHLLVFGVGVLKLKRGPAFKHREEKTSPLNLSCGVGRKSR